MSLRFKLITAVLIISVAVTCVNVFQIIRINQVETIANGPLIQDSTRLQLLQSAKADIVSLENQQKLSADLETSPSSVLSKQIIANIKSATTNLQQKVQAFINLKTDSDEQIDGQLKSGLNAQVHVVAGYSQKLEASSLTNKLILDKFNNSLMETDSALSIITKQGQADLSIEYSKIQNTTKQIKIIFALVTLEVTIAAILVVVLLSRSISNSLKQLRDSAHRIANGDLSASIAIHSNDEIGELAKSFRTMSERLRDSYARLALETERSKILLESLSEGVVAVDENSNVVLANDRALDIFENTREQIINKPIGQATIVYDDLDKQLDSSALPVVQAIQTSSPVEEVLNLHLKSGKKRMINIAANPVIVDNKTSGAIMAVRDVTKEKEIDRMKTEFISLASHQLRTPLSAIKWFSEMLVSGDAGELNPDQLEFAQNVADSTERMIALVNALLNISRIESGRIMVDPEPTDLKELVSGIINDLKAKTEEKQQNLIISVHQDLPKINVDPRLIGQVYLNLLTNAIKYTPKGGEISVFISRKDDEIISQVTDTGYGIPKQQQDRIFQKFFRASNAVKVETDGTGLGLYLIKAIVESSGGKIWFESEEGKGTTFWFSMPLSGMKAKEGEVTLDA